MCINCLRKSEVFVEGISVCNFIGKSAEHGMQICCHSNQSGIIETLFCLDLITKLIIPWVLWLDIYGFFGMAAYGKQCLPCSAKFLVTLHTATL